MRLCYLLLFFCGAIQFASAQRVPKAFRKNLHPEAKVIWATVQSTFEKTKDKKFVHQVYYVGGNNQRTHYITYRDKEGMILEGAYAEWWDDGTLRYQGEHLNNKRHGEWKIAFGASGNSAGSYKNGEREGKWIITDSLDRVTTESYYSGGKLDGKSSYFNENGELSREEIYQQGTLLEVIPSESEDTTTIEFALVEEMPAFPGCEELYETDYEAFKQCSQREMLMFIYKQIRYPPSARENGVEGSAIIRFVIDKDGQVSDIVARRGISDAIKTECIRLIKKMPKWRPGYQDGEPVKVNFILPIKFKLE